MPKLDGKIILVTGAARGIGEACVTKLLQEGAKVVATDVDENLLSKSISNWTDKYSESIRGCKLDVASEEEWNEVIAEIELTEGTLHGLVNNAGIVNLKPIEDLTLEEFNQTQDINLTGNFIGMKLVIDLMRRKNNSTGSIVNMSSLSGLTGTLYCGAYSASKGGNRLLTKAAALEIGAKGEFIRVNSMHPGVIMTPMQTEREGREEIWEGIRKTIPTGRLGEGEDIANGVCFLLSDASSFMTGAELTIDGGMRVALPGTSYNE
ncbi:MAG: SDR family oxidoreductase [SAR86 cluster bacterium]|nr:SDR family oxidoreductase [SAR86 cluster bacterium]